MTVDSPQLGARCPNADRGWESLPEWLREHYERYGADEITDSGWQSLVRDPALPIQVRGLSLHFVGPGPRHGAELCFQSAPEPDEPVDPEAGADEPEFCKVGPACTRWDEEEREHDDGDEYLARGRCYCYDD